MARDVSLAIGVSDAPKLPFLRGALNGARQFDDWAKSVGYESHLLTDEGGKVITVATLRAELDGLLVGEKIHRLLLYFAGHGVMRDAAEALWLLSDWYGEGRAVSVDGLRRRLQDFGIEQISVFADACRSLPTSIRIADLIADRVLGRGPLPNSVIPAVDKFVAAQDGTQTFALPGPKPEDARCLFTGVLLQGLWAARTEALSKLLPGRVTSSSLGDFLRKEVPVVAKRYGWEVDPDVSWSFPDDDNVYYGNFSGAAPRAPKFPDWPDPSSITEMAGSITESARDPLTSVRGSKFGKGIGGTTGDHYLIRAKPRRTLEILMKTQKLPRSVGTDAAIVVDGVEVAALWVPDSVRASYENGCWSIVAAAGGQLQQAVPVLVELKTGLFGAITAMPGFVASVFCDADGVSALVFHLTADFGPPDIASKTEEAILRMENDALKPEDSIDLAVELRHAKHAAPVLGAICAYLYDALGDVDSIRQMAYYYASERQAIPYDVALMAQLHGNWQGEHLIAHVPSVPSRRPRTSKEEQNAWLYTATPSAIAPVAGSWPWLRQGWVYLDDPTDVESRLIRPGLNKLTSSLTKARFATVKSDGGHRLAELFRLKRVIASHGK